MQLQGLQACWSCMLRPGLRPGDRRRASLETLSWPTGAFEAELLGVIDADKDSPRFYCLRSNWPRRMEHTGVKPGLDREGPCII